MESFITFAISNNLIEESWKEVAAAGLLGITNLLGGDTNSIPYGNIIKNEGIRTNIYKDVYGKPTIGVGHLITAESKSLFQQLFGTNVNFNAVISGKQKLTNGQAIQLFKTDLEEHIDRARQSVPGFDKLPQYVKNAIVDGFFRGDLSGSPKTLKLINQGKWEAAAAEYLNNVEYKQAKKKKTGVATRMDENYRAFQKYALELKALKK